MTEQSETPASADDRRPIGTGKKNPAVMPTVGARTRLYAIGAAFRSGWREVGEVWIVEGPTHVVRSAHGDRRALVDFLDSAEAGDLGIDSWCDNPDDETRHGIRVLYVLPLTDVRDFAFTAETEVRTLHQFRKADGRRVRYIGRY